LACDLSLAEDDVWGCLVDEAPARPIDDELARVLALGDEADQAAVHRRGHGRHPPCFVHQADSRPEFLADLDPVALVGGTAEAPVFDDLRLIPTAHLGVVVESTA